MLSCMHMRDGIMPMDGPERRQWRVSVSGEDALVAASPARAMVQHHVPSIFRMSE